MNIAKHVISKCGGAAVVATWLGRRAARVYHWTYDRARGGTGGLIPAGEQLPLLLAARKAGVDLRPDDFFGMSELPPLGIPDADQASTLKVGNDGPTLNDNLAEKVS
jgi:hypothetical protein